MSDQVKETREQLAEAEEQNDAALAAVLREKLSDLADQAEPAAKKTAKRG